MVEPRRLLGVLDARSEQRLVARRGQDLGVVGDEVLLHPRSPSRLDGQVEQALLRLVEELPGLLDGRLARLLLGPGLLRSGGHGSRRQSQQEPQTGHEGGRPANKRDEFFMDSSANRVIRAEGV